MQYIYLLPVRFVGQSLTASIDVPLISTSHLSPRHRSRIRKQCAYGCCIFRVLHVIHTQQKLIRAGLCTTCICSYNLVMGPSALLVDDSTHVNLELYIQFHKLKPTNAESKFYFYTK